MSEQILDSRYIDLRIDELFTEFEFWRDNMSDSDKQDISDEWGKPFDELTDDELLEEWQSSTDEGGEHKNLSSFRDEAMSSEWKYGVVLIREDYFTEYAQQLAEEIGAINRDASWPLNHINWDAAADELKNDYSQADLDGETYYYRS